MPKPEYSNKIVDSGNTKYAQKFLVATPTTGLIRMEWAAARYGQIVPTNWSKVDMIQYMTSYIPLRYTVHDAQNLIVNEAVTKSYEWLLLIEHDTMPPADAFLRLTDYMDDGSIPVVSGLYFTRSIPAEPMVYRGRGNHWFKDWKLGDKVWADGVPTGMLLIHSRLLKAMWNDSPEYDCNGHKIRRVFENPNKTWFNEDTGSQEVLVGTSDLDWCTRVINGGYLKKAGWPEIGKKKYPFLIDTNIRCMHIEQDGTQYPIGGVEQWCAERGMLRG